MLSNVIVKRVVGRVSFGAEFAGVPQAIAGAGRRPILVIDGMFPPNMPIQVGQKCKSLTTVGTHEGSLASRHVTVDFLRRKALHACLADCEKRLPVLCAHVVQKVRP